MKIIFKKEVFLVEYDKKYFSRVNGIWCVNTGGDPLDWAPIPYGAYSEDFKVKLETLFSNLYLL